MQARTPFTASLAAVLSAAALVTLPGCAVMRGQETVGSYIDDATITTQVKAKMVENKQVDAGAIKVETLNGTVMLSGFAKNETERAAAERVARDVDGVKSVKNQLVIRP
jgi:hyperosmotically inducible periplasmic protein